MKRQAGNPYLPNYEYVPDAEPYVFGDRLYVFGSHDCFGGMDFCVNDYVGWSAPLTDLSDWRYEGVIYRKEQDPSYSDSPDYRLFAPDVQRGPDGRYYLYYAFSHSGRINVAVCDTPAGKYEYYGTVRHGDGVPLGARQGDMFQYDPGVLVDDDGKIYLYSGFCFDPEKIPKLRGLPENRWGAMVIELEPDMVTVRREPKFLIPCKHNSAGTGFEGHAFFEASSIRKIGNTYYFIYSSENGHELCYATSDSPTEGFRYRGILVSNGDLSFRGRTQPLNYTGTNHGSLEQINGDWYVFYHRQTNGTPYARQGCAEKVTVRADGFIPQVEITSCGLNGEPFAGRGEYGAYLACCLMSRNGACEYLAKTRVDDSHPYLTQEGPDREENPNQYIHNLQDGAKAGFRYFRMDGAASIGVVVRGAAQGTLVVAGGEDGQTLAALPVTPSETWTEVWAPLAAAAGVRELWFRFEGRGRLDFQKFILK